MRQDTRRYRRQRHHFRTFGTPLRRAEQNATATEQDARQDQHATDAPRLDPLAELLAAAGRARRGGAS